MLVAIFIAIYIGCIGHAAWTDATRMKISNSVSIILVIAFLLFAAIHLPLTPAITHIGVASAIFAVTFGCYALRLMGGGDVKLLSALAMWIGPGQILPYLTAVALLGGLLAVFVLIARRVIPEPEHTNSKSITKYIATWATSGRVPYALPIGGAALSYTNTIFGHLL